MDVFMMKTLDESFKNKETVSERLLKTEEPKTSPTSCHKWKTEKKIYDHVSY